MEALTVSESPSPSFPFPMSVGWGLSCSEGGCSFGGGDSIFSEMSALPEECSESFGGDGCFFSVSEAFFASDDFFVALDMKVTLPSYQSYQTVYTNHPAFSKPALWPQYLLSPHRFVRNRHCIVPFTALYYSIKPKMLLGGVAFSWRGRWKTKINPLPFEGLPNYDQ